MGISEKDWQEEQQRVDKVITEVDRQITTLTERVGDLKEEIVNIRKDFWEDVTVNAEDLYEMAETYASMRQQSEILTEREVTHRHGYNQLKALKRLKNSPYFGRIDFREEGEPETEQIYLGIASLLDESGDHFLVYDWRAPVSSLYYDYPPGPAQYKTPVCTITGDLELKRQYVIQQGHIESMFDTGVTIGDELLQKVLGQQVDNQMKGIVATIQKEQNLIIRNVRSRLLVVQGAAGSGKTSAALQRVAYLLYRYRETLRADQIVLFSPNPMFNSYVSTVLPELGEENMQQTTFQDYLYHWLGKTFALEDPFTQMEYALTAMNEPGYKARMEGIQYKASADYLHLIEKYVTYLGQQDLLFKDIKFRGEVLLSSQWMEGEFYALDPSLPIPNRMQILAKRILEILKEKEREERDKPWVEEEIELLEKEDYMEVYEKLRRKKGFTEDSFDDFDREHELLSVMVVKKHFKPLRKRVKNLRFIHILGTYRQLFHHAQYALSFISEGHLPSQWSEICEQTIEKLGHRELAYEDATPYLYFKELIEGFQTNTLVRHVFIDEAQDYSPFQFSFIKRLFPHCKMTILGDLRQAIYAHAGSGAGFASLTSLYGEEETETVVLTRSYRSTRPIVEFTRGMMVGGEEIDPFNRDGKKPTLVEVESPSILVTEIVKQIRSLQNEGYRTVAVICKTAQESSEAYEALKREISLRLISKESASFVTGVLVIPAYLAKGIEFDAVIIYNGSQAQYGREGERKLFYTACTRAMHALHIYSLGPISSFITEVPSETYILEG